MTQPPWGPGPTPHNGQGTQLQPGVYPNVYPTAPVAPRHAPVWVSIAGVVLSTFLIVAGIGYVVVINTEGILTEMIDGSANRSEDLLWFSMGVPILGGIVALGMFLVRRAASFVVAGIIALLALVVAGAQFTFGAPSSFYMVGAMTVAVSALLLILSFVGIIVSPRS